MNELDSLSVLPGGDPVAQIVGGKAEDIRLSFQLNSSAHRSQTDTTGIRANATVVAAVPVRPLDITELSSLSATTMCTGG